MIYLRLMAAIAFLAMPSFGYKWASLKDKGPVAIVSYTLDKASLVKEGETASGPGLMQSPEKYYALHREILSALWEQFQSNIGSVFKGTEFVANDKIISSETYQSITKPNLKKVLGKEVGIGADKLSPEGMNYISTYAKEKLDSLTEALNVPVLMLIDMKAVHGSGLNMKRGGDVMKMTFKIFCYEKGTGTLIEDEIKVESLETAPVVMGQVHEKHFKRLMISAQEQALVKIQELLKRFYNE